MSYGPYDTNMPGPGDIWSKHTPFDDEDEIILEDPDDEDSDHARECECRDCLEELEALEADARGDEMRLRDDE